ncbi:MAG: hypothetical protein HC913_16605 [Microscillaceae bacterium]|nr:hypothetical protein [Microscillaceae bacterium]
MKFQKSLLLPLLPVFLMAFLMTSPAALAQKSRTTKEKTEKAPKKEKSKGRETASTDEGKLSREEEKALKNELKAFQKDLKAFKKFKDDKARTERELAAVATELVRVKELEAQCAKEVEGLRDEIDELRRKLEECNGSKTAGFGIPGKGQFFVVQIGAFQQKDVSVNNDNPDFRKENADGFNKYIWECSTT